MKSLLIIDVGIFVIAVLTAFLKEDFMLIIDIMGCTGLVFIVAAGILSGSFVSGDRIRANYYDEIEEIKEKKRWSKNLIFVGIFNVVISIFAYEFTQQVFAVMN